MKPASPVSPPKSKQSGNPFSSSSLPHAVVLFLHFLGFSMEDFRSTSYADGRTQIEPYGTIGLPLPSYNRRSSSTSHGSSYSGKEAKLKKGDTASSLKGGWLSDPELQRKKRVAGYKVYSAEGKVKGTFRKSFQWMKDRYTQVIYSRW